MRYLLIVFCASAVLVCAAAADANAQLIYRGNTGCTKGLLWPFVRKKGDCLTEAETAAGMTGNYQDPEGTFERPSPDAVAAPPPAASAVPDDEAAAPETAIAAPNAAVPPPERTLPAPNVPDAAKNDAVGLARDSIASPAPVARSASADSATVEDRIPARVAAPSAAGSRTEYSGAEGCPKGLLWPFVRRPGDCLTAAEKAAGMTGNYQEPDAAGAASAVLQENR